MPPLCLPEPSPCVAVAPYFRPAPAELGGCGHVLVACTDHPVQLYDVLESYQARLAGEGNGWGESSVSGRSSKSSGASSSSVRGSSPTDPPAPRPQPLATYPLIHGPTEAFIFTTSLLWPSSGAGFGQYFLTGSSNLIALFDVTRPGSSISATNSSSSAGSSSGCPLVRLPTIPSARHALKGGGVGMRGAVSALAVQPAAAAVAAGPGDGAEGGEAAAAGGWGLVAAGTWTRHVGLYDLTRSGVCAATWGVAGAACSPPSSSHSPPSGSDTTGTADPVGGQGVMQLLWSPCGRYLVVSERKSAGLLVYDVRVSGRLLGWLDGRGAATGQRLWGSVFVASSSSDSGGGGGDAAASSPSMQGGGGDIAVAKQGETGFEVWSGGCGGVVQVWDGVGTVEGPQRAKWRFRVAGTDEDGGGGAAGAAAGAVSSAALHPSGSVLATCAGGWYFGDEYDEDSDEEEFKVRTTVDNGLKVWSIGNST